MVVVREDGGGNGMSLQEEVDVDGDGEDEVAVAWEERWRRGLAASERRRRLVGFWEFLK